MTRNRFAVLALVLIAVIAGSLIAQESGELKLTAPQQAAIDKIKEAGGQVLRVAANSDALDVAFHLSEVKGVDALLPLVKSLPNVTKLNLAGTDVTDGGLKEVGAIKTLTHLHLEKTKITDAGLASLKGLASLEYLNLYGTAVTDKGLAELKGMKGLKKVYVWESKVTEAGAEDLRKAVAGIYVNTGWETPTPIAAKPEPANTEPEKITIELIMKKAHKGEDSTVQKAIAGSATEEQLKQLLAYYQEMAKLKPPKGDDKSWKDKTEALVAATTKLAGGDKSAAAALKTAAACKACHELHRE